MARRHAGPGARRPSCPERGRWGHRSIIPGAPECAHVFVSLRGGTRESIGRRLSTAEQDALAQHVEGCASCLERLARLAETPDTQRWRRAEHPPEDSSAEERVM